MAAVRTAVCRFASCWACAGESIWGWVSQCILQAGVPSSRRVRSRMILSIEIDPPHSQQPPHARSERAIGPSYLLFGCGLDRFRGPRGSKSGRARAGRNGGDRNAGARSSERGAVALDGYVATGRNSRIQSSRRPPSLHFLSASAINRSIRSFFDRSTAALNRSI